MKLSKTKLNILKVLLLLTPVLLFNLWVFLFKDYLLSVVLYLFTLWIVPVVFHKLTDLHMSDLAKDWKDFVPFDGVKKKSHKAKYFFILGLLILAVVGVFLWKQLDFHLTLLAQNPNLGVTFNVIYGLVVAVVTCLLLPCLEVDYYFEFGYNTIASTLLAKVVTALLLTIKYVLFVVYVYSISDKDCFIGIELLGCFLLHFVLSFIYGGESKTDVTICLAATYLVSVLMFVVLAYGDKFGIVNVVVQWNNPNNIFNVLFN